MNTSLKNINRYFTRKRKFYSNLLIMVWSVATGVFIPSLNYQIDTIINYWTEYRANSAAKVQQAELLEAIYDTQLFIVSDGRFPSDIREQIKKDKEQNEKDKNFDANSRKMEAQLLIPHQQRILILFIIATFTAAFATNLNEATWLYLSVLIGGSGIIYAVKIWVAVERLAS